MVHVCSFPHIHANKILFQFTPCLLSDRNITARLSRAICSQRMRIKSSLQELKIAVLVRLKGPKWPSRCLQAKMHIIGFCRQDMMLYIQTSHTNHVARHDEFNLRSVCSVCKGFSCWPVLRTRSTMKASSFPLTRALQNG